MLKLELETVLKSLGSAYRQRLTQGSHQYSRLKEKPAEASASWIGKYAQSAWMKQDLPDHSNRGVRLARDPWTAVSGLGNPRKFDAAHVTLDDTKVCIELKKSDYAGYRAQHQKAAQLCDLGLGTHGAELMVRICGENGVVQVWSRRQAEKALTEKEFEVPEPLEIRFAPDLVTPKKRASEFRRRRERIETRSQAGA